MTRAADCCTQMIKLLHGVEDKIEHENMLNPDPRLTEMELSLHRCINEFERIAKRPVTGCTHPKGALRGGVNTYTHCTECGTQWP